MNGVSALATRFCVPAYVDNMLALRFTSTGIRARRLDLVRADW